MADVVSVLMSIIRMFAANRDEVKIPKRSEVLASWALPMMSRALEADEKEREAMDMFESIERLSRRQKKNEINPSA